VRGLAAEERLEGVAIRRAFAGRRALDRCTVLEMAVYVLMQSGAAFAELRRFRPDVVHVHFAVPSGAVAWFATRLCAVPYVITAHLGDVPGGATEQTDHLYRWLTPLTMPIWRAAAATTAVAPHVSQLVEQTYRLRPEVILSGIDMRRRIVPSPRPGDVPLRLVWCGRIQEQKNLSVAVEALATIAGRPWTFDIIGDGPLRDSVEKSMRAAGLAEHVRFRGWLAAGEVESILAASDIMFLPSLSEGLPIVTVEALRAGLAFVASRIPGISDVVIDGENGILCDPRRPESFAGAIADFLDNRDRLQVMRQASAARAPLFDEERIIDAYIAVLRRAACKDHR
jgi:glycosyltransferase involved in cell wall biosynthesis